MVQRHPNDTVERLWPGATDPNDPKFVPLELRDAVADIPADIEQRLRRELYTTGEMILTDGRKATHTLNPAADLDDLEVALVWRKKEWARRLLAGQRQDAERVARDATLYTCAVCGRVHPPVQTGRHTARRNLADGRIVTVCATCFGVCEQVAVAALAAEPVEGGRTRLEAARALLERSRP